MKILLKVIVSLVIIINAYFFYQGHKSQEMKGVNNFNGSSLEKCPNKPNCVSSFEELKSANYIAPIKATMQQFEGINLEGMNNPIMLENYKYFTHTSSIYKFVDDLELFYKDGLIYFRSASRVGYSDLNANRERVERIKAMLQ